MPKDNASQQRRANKLLERERQKTEAQNKQKIEKLEAIVAANEDQLAKFGDLDSILDPMDIDEVGTTGNGSTGVASSSANESLPESSSNDPAETVPSSLQGQGQNQSQEDRPNETSQSDEGEGQTQPSNKQQIAAGSQSQTQQSDSQEEETKPSNPLIKREDEDHKTPLSALEEEYGIPLLKGSTSGIEDDVTTVGWTGGIGTKFINRYGKKSAARYRLQSFPDRLYNENNLPAEQNISNQDNRLSDRKVGTKWEFTRRHLKSIYGVAWMTENDHPSQDDLDLLDPDASRKRWVRTYVLVAWEIPGPERGQFVTKMTWEPRSALRARWGGKQADKAIYQAACEAEKRYEQQSSGKASAIDRTPSAGLIDKVVDRLRSISATPSSTTDNKESSATPEPGHKDRSGSDVEKWRAGYLKLYGVKQFSDLETEDKAEMMKVYLSQFGA